MAYQVHALVTDPSRYLDGNIYHPARHAVLYGDPGLGALPIFAPIFLATGNPTLAINLVLLLGITLTAWSLHLVVARWTESWAAGLVGATTFLTNSWEIPWFFGCRPTPDCAAAMPMGLLAAENGSSGIALARTQGAVLELPVGPGGVDPRFHAPPMYRSIFHWRPLLNGYSSYWPTGFPERMALAGRLPDDDALATLVRETGLAVVTVNLARYAPADRAVWLTLAKQRGAGRLQFALAEGSELLFLVDRSGLE